MHYIFVFHNDTNCKKIIISYQQVLRHSGTNDHLVPKHFPVTCKCGSRFHNKKILSISLPSQKKAPRSTHIHRTSFSFFLFFFQSNNLVRLFFSSLFLYIFLPSKNYIHYIEYKQTKNLPPYKLPIHK